MANRRSNLRVPQRRKMVWARESLPSLLSAPGSHDLLSSFRQENGGAQPVGSTITRVRGTLAFTHSGPATAGTGLLWGLIVARSTLTPAEVPDPSLDKHADWMAWNFVHTSVDGGGATVTASVEVDVKSQRKMEELGETLWLSFTEQPGLADVQVLFVGSVLLKLP